MEAKDFEFYSIGQYHDLVMSGDGAIFELNESRAMINIAFTDMTAEEIDAIHNGTLDFFLSVVESIVFLVAVFENRIVFDMPFNAGLYKAFDIENPAPYGYFYMVIAVERRTNTITALRAGAFDPDFSARLYSFAKRQWNERIRSFTERLESVYSRYSQVDILRHAIANNIVRR